MKSITVLSIIVVLILTACGTGDDGTGNPAPDSGSAQTDGDPKSNSDSDTPKSDSDEGGLRDCILSIETCRSKRSVATIKGEFKVGVYVECAKVELNATFHALNEKNGLEATAQTDALPPYGHTNDTSTLLWILNQKDKESWPGHRILITVSRPGVCMPVQGYVIVE